jgi:acetolactate decarboxylase
MTQSTKNPNVPGSHKLKVNISDSILNALKHRCEQTGETLDHVVQDALAKSLGVDHHTLFQVSTSTALVQGVYQGCITVGQIKTHGDFGLGTFDSLNGEGIMLDGRVWQALGDGLVVEPSDDTTAPFWVSAQFEADRSGVLSTVESWADLIQQIDGFRESSNLFTAIRIDGVFDEIYYRVACKAEPGETLVEATHHQSEFTFKDCTGSLMGFWSPTFARTFNIPGYHMHFLSADHQHGGHVLGIKAKNLKIQVMNANNVMMALPETPAFLSADLSIDPSKALGQAEGAQAK